jgi:SAM-dependent methyltransferase
MDSRVLKKTYLQIPTRRTASRMRSLGRALMGIVLTPVYWLVAYSYRTPGLRFRVDCTFVGLRLLFGRKGFVSAADIRRLLFLPMDSTRYFEFAFIWDAVSKLSPVRYLDVSSPHAFPIVLMLQKPSLLGELVNPDVSDLASTANFVKALDLQDRCNLRACLIDAAPFRAGSFDVITSISVVEHIRQDTEAIQKMWDFLKPGGRLFLTLPCASEASERYNNRNEYGLVTPDEEGNFFFYRLYDEKSLEQRIFSVTGQPRRQVIYGEKSAGTLLRNLDQKMADPLYPYWREPYMMGRDFRYFECLGDLPGDGVIGLEFEKGAQH